MSRKATVTTSASIKLSVGNFETIDAQKTLAVEIEFDKPEELADRSKSMDSLVIRLLKAEVEQIVDQIGRRRIMKINGVETPVDLWKSYVKAVADDDDL